jgi:dolichol kinase
MSTIGLTEILLIVTVCLIFAIIFLLIPYWRIFEKAGFSPAFSLLMILPIVNLVMIYYLAFAEWPSLKQGQSVKEVR